VTLADPTAAGRRRQRQMVWAIALAAGVLTALARWTPLYDPDGFWHLHTGRYIVATGQLPWIDSFSHTARGRPWRFIDAVADILLYGAWRAGGAAGLLLLTVSLGMAAVTLSVLAQARELGARASAAPLLLVAPLLAATVAFRLTPRPQTFAFVALAALLLLVVVARERPSLLWAAPALVALWQTLHPSGPLGVLALAATATASLLDRRPGQRPFVLTAAVTVAAAVALLACPHPIDRLRAGFSHVSDQQLAALITEWQPAWRLPSAAVAALAALLALAVIGAVAPRDRRPDLALLLIAGGFALLAARAVRFVPLGGLALAPVAVQGADRLVAFLGRVRLRPLVALLGLAALVPLYAERKPFGSGVHPGAMPVGAARFIARTQPTGNLVHDFEMGGYLMWTLGPAHPVFVDGRSWALYDPDLLLTALQMTPERLDRAISRYDLRLAVFWTNGRVGTLQDEGWRLVYLDDVASVLVRQPDDAAYPTRFGYRELHPTRWFEDIARWAQDPAALARADAESARMVSEAPQSALAWVLRGGVAMAAGHEEEADQDATRALRLRPDLTAPHRLMMLRCARRGDRACACAESAAVAARAPGNQQARAMALSLGCR
jgi:hypothetical protein